MVHRYEAKADKMLDEAEAMTELNGSDNSTDALLGKYSKPANDDVDDELEKMKKELGI